MDHHPKEEIKTVLVVEDDEAVRRLEVRILSQLGHKVLEAEGPARAMELAADLPACHLLLTDFSMPTANGLELARQFRAVHPETPVLMVSGSLAALENEDFSLDRFAVLAKPFTSEDLVQRVCTLLSGSSNQGATAYP